MSADTDSPPSYLQAFKEAAEIIENLPIESKIKVYESIQAQLNTDKTKKNLADEVKNLADNAKNIGNLFQSVTLKLESADKKEYPGVEELTPGWKDLHAVSLGRKCLRGFFCQ